LNIGYVKVPKKNEDVLLVISNDVKLSILLN